MLSSATALWYASRATGVVALILLSIVVVLGILVNRRALAPGRAGLTIAGLHRFLSLLAVTFVAAHVLTAVLDSYVSISPAAAVIPLASSYEPFWLGLGAVSLDLMAAVIVTSLLRRFLGRRTWRAVHWLAYISWPVAVAHSVGSSRDLQGGWLLGLAAGCCLAVATAAALRARAARAALPRSGRVPEALRRQRELTAAGRR